MWVWRVTWKYSHLKISDTKNWKVLEIYNFKGMRTTMFFCKNKVNLHIVITVIYSSINQLWNDNRQARVPTLFVDNIVSQSEMKLHTVCVFGKAQGRVYKGLYVVCGQYRLEMKLLLFFFVGWNAQGRVLLDRSRWENSRPLRRTTGRQKPSSWSTRTVTCVMVTSGIQRPSRSNVIQVRRVARQRIFFCSAFHYAIAL